MKKIFGSGKTLAGAIAVAACAVLDYFGYHDIAKLVGGLGCGTIAVGLGHKLQKLLNG